ncbi:MAG: membrane-bound lytic murein transglycosylase MltF [Gammaproteobacteria bacterium]|nr:membrane-bound lytic murein transglycosylase MltF [Gammaproteobacteria bacterium]
MNLAVKKIVQRVLLIAAIGISACDQDNDVSPGASLSPAESIAAGDAQESSATLLEQIRQRGRLIVLTTNQPTTYYFDRDNEVTGPEYDMTQAFAQSLEINVEYKVYDSTKDVLQALRDNEGDIAAAGLTLNDNRKQEFDYGPVYQATNEYLVCHRSKKVSRDKNSFDDLHVVVAADSSYIESLNNYPEIIWTADEDHNTVRLLEQVAGRKIGCTISDSTLYDIERRYYTELQNKYTLAEASQLAWMLNKNSGSLKQAIHDWFKNYKSNGDLANVLDRYYGYIQIFDYVDTHKFLKRVETRFSKYKDFFFDAAAKNDIEPLLLAAQSYQESHWDRKAKSPTGVRGLMMLTQPTAKSLGVKNRLLAKENIYAGAKFHARMKKMVEQVDEPDRTWLALAAYNIGRGHFRDAQSLAKKLNKNPDRWHDMKQILPLLSEKKYYKDLRYGYARGSEPVRYVMRIRNYHELLQRYFAAAEP